MRLTENEVVRKLHEFIDECDADMIAHFAGDFFGGDCEFIGLKEYDYEFTPNNDYMGAFDPDGVDGWIDRHDISPKG